MEEKRPVGRPKGNEEMVYLRVRVPKKLLIIADGLKIPYKQNVRSEFEMMVCIGILTERGETNCEICKNVVTRNRMIEEEFQKNRERYTESMVKQVAAIKSAISKGLSRGEAEDTFGHVFPDDLWNKYSREE